MAAMPMPSPSGNQRNSRPLSRIARQLPCLTPQYQTNATISEAATCVGPVINTKRRASVVEPANNPVAARTGSTRTKDASQPENASRTRPTVFNFAGYRLAGLDRCPPNHDHMRQDLPITRLDDTYQPRGPS